MKTTFAASLIAAFCSASTTEWNARQMRQQTSKHYDYMSPAAWGVDSAITSMRNSYPSRKAHYRSRSSYGKPSFYGSSLAASRIKDPFETIDYLVIKVKQLEKDLTTAESKIDVAESEIDVAKTKIDSLGTDSARQTDLEAA